MPTAVTAVRRSRPLVAVLIASAALVAAVSLPGGAKAADGAGVAGARGAVAPASAPGGPNASTAQGFIMSDGRICDPIRHMGC